MWLYKGRTCFAVTFSLPLSLPFDWTFKTWSMFLLFCLFWVDVMLWCCVWKEIKKMLITKKKSIFFAKNIDKSLLSLFIHLTHPCWIKILISLKKEGKNVLTLNFWIVYCITKFLFWINTVLFIFLSKNPEKKYDRSQKNLSSTNVSNIDYKSAY